MYFSPDQSQMIALETKGVYFIKRNGNIYNETIQVEENYEFPLYAEFTPDGQYLYIVQRNGLTRVLEKNITDLWEEKVSIDLNNPGGDGTFAGCINHDHTKVMTHWQGNWREFEIDVEKGISNQIDSGTFGEMIFGMQFRADDKKIFLYR